MVEVSVDDEGPGMPDAKLVNVFDRFYSERPKGERFGQHSGLGLSISKQIVEALKGRIAAETGGMIGGRCWVRGLSCCCRWGDPAAFLDARGHRRARPPRYAPHRPR